MAMLAASPPCFFVRVRSRGYAAPRVRSALASDAGASALSQKAPACSDLIRARLLENASGSLPPVEAYDVAWIARIPLAGSGAPRFPQCVRWLVDNQGEDGSWGQVEGMKTITTLACVVALAAAKQGGCNIEYGLQFVNSALSAPVSSEDSLVLLSSFLQDAEDMHLELPFKAPHVQSILATGREALRRISLEALHEYPICFLRHLEAMHKLINWRRLLTALQCSNGSIFNSVPLTVCAYMHTGDRNCLRYVETLLNKDQAASWGMGGLVEQLYMVDWLQRLGVRHYFDKEIQDVASQAYRIWQPRAPCEDEFYRTLCFDECGTTGMPSKLSENECQGTPWYASLPRLVHREHIVKLRSKFGRSREDEAMLLMAVQDYNACQVLYQEELGQILQWYQDLQIEFLNLPRNKAVVCYFAAASNLCHRDMSLARIVWAKMGVLTTIIDDYFDNHNSLEDLQEFYNAVLIWDAASGEGPSDKCILLRALFTTAEEVGRLGARLQGRDIGKHLRGQWEMTVRAFLKEAEWRLLGTSPNMKEYLDNAVFSFALEPIMMATIFFMGAEVDDNLIDHPETSSLFRKVSLVGRLLNDIRGLERELEAGETCWITIAMRDNPELSVEACTLQAEGMIEEVTRELTDELFAPGRMPKACRLVFQGMTRILHFLYKDADGFTSSNDLSRLVKDVIYNPVT